MQDQFFGASSQSAFLPPPGEPRHALVDRFVVPPPLCFDARAARAHYEGLLATSRASGRTAILSHERFSGYPPAGGFDSTIIADRLVRTFPEARILMVVREQIASIRSMYMQHITDGGDLDLGTYLSRPARFFKRRPVFAPEFYEYDRLYGRYRELFGAERVLVLPFEMLRAQPGEFLRRLGHFVGHDLGEIALFPQNAARSESFQVFQRYVNRFLADTELTRGGLIAWPRFWRRFGNFGRSLRPLLQPLDRHIAARRSRFLERRFGGVFAASNDRLAQMTGCDLASYGYQTRPSTEVSTALSPTETATTLPYPGPGDHAPLTDPEGDIRSRPFLLLRSAIDGAS